MEGYEIKRITRKECKGLLERFHYIHKAGGNFRSGINYGLFKENVLIGVSIFHTNSAKGIVKGCFGIESYKLDGFYELGRLAVDPEYSIKNLTSWFLGGAIRIFRKERNVSVMLTYADSDLHTGYIYQALNFKYYGLTAPKKDFFEFLSDGTERKVQRGKVKHLNGEWRDKSQKHRYMIIYDKNLKTRWTELPYPKLVQKAPFNFVSA